MADTSRRLLTLLSLLQTPREWSGPELAGRLGVSTRTIRHDVERLRSLGYPVDATRGSVGGYRLGAGAALPPLLLEDDEAVAIALSLRSVAGGSVAGLEESALRALSKLQQVLPARLGRRVDAVVASTVRVGSGAPGVTAVDASVLQLLASACRDQERVRFAYADHAGTSTQRTVEPHRLVSWGRRWYLVAWDRDRDDWRTFRADRIGAPAAVGARFGAREVPGGDAAAFVRRGTRSVQWAVMARVRVHEPATTVSERLGSAAESVEAEGADRCVVMLGGADAESMAPWLGLIGAEFEVLGPPELAAAVQRLGHRMLRAAGD
ncbi:helix-turn-helix transcriptional regulator [Kineosporia succinea]|uniref:DNA-binding transcriptional regulator YafY n=1 Tax=Kineosporia succinea TaxID=84632 RepID=A0ABT9NWP1_9ACTN|nr:YafY family protein [Kineosporia succinea]MDP9824843.1 putative DNA-binding transcriptional regulator YafY [Kineosporia succinea]